MYLTKKCNYYKLIIKIKIGGSKMALIGKKLENFTVQAYQNEEFKELNFEKDMLGKWNIFVLYPNSAYKILYRSKFVYIS